MLFELKDYSFVDPYALKDTIAVEHAVVVDRDRGARFRKPLAVHVHYEFLGDQRESDRTNYEPYKLVPSARSSKSVYVSDQLAYLDVQCPLQQGRLGRHGVWRLSYGPVVQPG